MKTRIWLIVLLVGGYIICQSIADVTATKIVQIGSITVPAATIIYALTFTMRDLLHKKLGRDWARATIICAGICNVFQAAYFWFASLLPSPDFFALGDSWNAIFSFVPGITIGSILAEVISQMLDTEIYHALMKKVPQWASVLISNAASLFVDSVLFIGLAFVVLPHLFGGQSVTVVAAISLIGGQMLLKGIVTIVSLPSIYLVKYGN